MRTSTTRAQKKMNNTENNILVISKLENQTFVT